MTKGKPKDGSKNPGGRPAIWTPQVIEALADEMRAFYQRDKKAMLLEDFCAKKEIPLEYMSRFEKDNEKFGQTKKAIESLLTSRLFKAAANGEIHATIGIFGLKNSGTKWKDKQEINHSGDIATTHRYEIPNKRPIE